MRFVLTDKERSDLEGFLERHADCVNSGLVIDHNHDNGIGWATKVACGGCGDEKNITDYSVW